MSVIRKKDRLTYVFDLDGTLCTHEEDYFKASPYPLRIALVNLLHRRGHHIIIDTARGTESGIDYRVMTMDQLRAWGVEYDILRLGNKFAADCYIDDKAINIKDFKL